MANFDIIYKIATDLTGLKKGVDDTAQATQQIDKRMVGLQKSVADAGKALLGAFAAKEIGQAIYNMAESVIQLGSNLADVSAKTGISLKGLQLLKVAAEQNGVSLDQVAQAANKLGINIAGGGKDVVTAVSKLGLSMADLKKGSPEDNLFAISKAMDGIENPAERAKIAVSLFGKAGLELLPVLNGQFAESAAAAERLGIVIGDDVLQAADKFDDQMVVVRATLMKVVADALAPMLPGLLDLAQFLAKLTAGTIAFGRAVVDFFIGALIKAREEFYGFAAVVADISDHIPLLGRALGGAGFSFEAMKAKAQEAADQYKLFTAETKAAADGTDKHAAATKKALPILGEWGNSLAENKKKAEEQALAVELVKNRLNAIADTKNVVEANKDFWKKIHEDTLAIAKRMIDDVKERDAEIRKILGKPLELFKGTSNDTFGTGDLLEKTADAWLKGLKKAAPSLKDQLTGVVETIPQTLVAAFTGGGGLSGAIQAIGSQLGSVLGKSIGASFSSLGKLGGPIGAALGGLIGPLAGFLGTKLNQGGGTAAQKQSQDLLNQTLALRNAFLDTSGSLVMLEAKAANAGTTLDRVLNAKTPKEYQKAIDDLNAAFAFQDQAMQTLDDTVKKYGFTLAEVPEKFRQGKLDEQFLTLYQDQRVLTAGGFEFDAVIRKQADSFNELIKTAIETGATIPEQLKPAVQRMIDLGLATDENGNKLTDLSKLSFAETLDAKFSTLIDTINRLADAIERGVGNAFATVAANAEAAASAINDIRAPDVGGGSGGDSGSYGSRGGYVGRRGIAYLAGGGPIGPFIPRGIDTVPSMLSVGEGVLSRDGMRALGALNRGVSPNVVSMAAFLEAQNRTNESLAGLRRDLSTTIPAMVGTAARHGVQTRGGKR